MSTQPDLLCMSPFQGVGFSFLSLLWQPDVEIHHVRSIKEPKVMLSMVSDISWTALPSPYSLFVNRETTMLIMVMTNEEYEDKSVVNSESLLVMMMVMLVWWVWVWVYSGQYNMLTYSTSYRKLSSLTIINLGWWIHYDSSSCAHQIIVQVHIYNDVAKSVFESSAVVVILCKAIGRINIKINQKQTWLIKILFENFF